MSQRAAFEQWARSEDFSLLEGETKGQYYYAATDGAWAGWQAGMAEGIKLMQRIAANEAGERIDCIVDREKCEACRVAGYIERAIRSLTPEEVLKGNGNG